MDVGETRINKDGKTPRQYGRQPIGLDPRVTFNAKQSPSLRQTLFQNYYEFGLSTHSRFPIAVLCDEVSYWIKNPFVAVRADQHEVDGS